MPMQQLTKYNNMSLSKISYLFQTVQQQITSVVPIFQKAYQLVCLNLFSQISAAEDFSSTPLISPPENRSDSATPTPKSCLSHSPGRKLRVSFQLPTSAPERTTRIYKTSISPAKSEKRPPIQSSVMSQEHTTSYFESLNYYDYVAEIERLESMSKTTEESSKKIEDELYLLIESLNEKPAILSKLKGRLETTFNISLEEFVHKKHAESLAQFRRTNISQRGY